jgi:hypothetical protein
MPLRQAGTTLYCLDHTRPVYGIMIGGVCFWCSHRRSGTCCYRKSHLRSGRRLGGKKIARHPTNAIGSQNLEAMKEEYQC